MRNIFIEGDPIFPVLFMRENSKHYTWTFGEILL
jgi:hypothetical protein